MGLRVEPGTLRTPGNHPPLKDPTEALNEIALYFNMLDYTEEEWGHSFHSLFMRVIKGIREVVIETGSLTPKDSGHINELPDP